MEQKEPTKKQKGKLLTTCRKAATIMLLPVMAISSVPIIAGCSPSLPEEVKQVHSAIDNIPNQIIDRDEFYDALEAAEALYDALSPEFRAKVNSSKLASLHAARLQLADFDRSTAMAMAIGFVEDLITLIPELIFCAMDDDCQDGCTIESQKDKRDAFDDLLKTAKDAFDALATWVFDEEDALDIRDYLKPEKKQALFDAMDALANYIQEIDWAVEIEKVIDLISKIPDLSLEQLNETNIEAFRTATITAKAAYDGLENNDLRDRVTNKGLLLGAEADIQTYSDAVSAVGSAISLIETLDATSLNLRADRADFVIALYAAQAAYQSLANFSGSGVSFQGYVTNASDLINAQGKLTQFDNTDVPAADAFVSLVGLIPALSTINADNYIEINADFIIPARQAFDALTAAQRTLVDEEAGRLAQLEQTIIDAEQAVFIASIPQLTVSISGTTINWNEITAADSYDVSYTFVSLDEDIVETKTITNIEDTTLEFADQGFVYNLVVKANMKEDFEFINRTGVIADVNLVSTMSLAAAVQEVATNNPTGADNNYMMAFMVNNALKELEQEENVHVRSRGMSMGNAQSNGNEFTGTSSTGVRLTLAVGGDIVINRDPENNFAVSEAYSDKFAYASLFTNSGLASLGNGANIAAQEATRANRVYYNGEQRLMYNQYIYGYGTGSSLTGLFTGTVPRNGNGADQFDWANSTLSPNWDTVRIENNRKQIIAQDVWMENAKIAPYNWFPYIITADTLIGSHGTTGDVRTHRTSNGNDLQTTSVSRQRIFYNDVDGTFTFRSFNDASQALALNKYEQMRMGSLINATTDANSYLFIDYRFDANLKLVGFKLYCRSYAENPAGKSHTNEIVDFEIKTGEEATYPMWRATEDEWKGESAEGQPKTDLPAAITKMPVLWWNGGGQHVNTVSGCLAEGSLVTMADGSKKPVEKIKEGDRALVWNFYEGRFDTATVVALSVDKNVEATVIDMKFADGNSLKLVNDHCLYDLTKNAYVNITKDNAKQFIGDSFVCHSKDAKTRSEAKLVDVKISKQKIGAYTPVTYKHLDVFANGILTSPGEVHNSVKNIFKVNTKTLSYDEKNYDELVSKYGLLTWKEFKKHISIMTEELFDALNVKYINIRMGRDGMTWAEVKTIVETVLSFL